MDGPGELQQVHICHLRLRREPRHLERHVHRNLPREPGHRERTGDQYGSGPPRAPRRRGEVHSRSALLSPDNPVWREHSADHCPAAADRPSGQLGQREGVVPDSDRPDRRRGRIASVVHRRRRRSRHLRGGEGSVRQGAAAAAQMGRGGDAAARGDSIGALHPRCELRQQFHIRREEQRRIVVRGAGRKSDVGGIASDIRSQHVEDDRAVWSELLRRASHAVVLLAVLRRDHDDRAGRPAPRRDDLLEQARRRGRVRHAVRHPLRIEPR